MPPIFAAESPRVPPQAPSAAPRRSPCSARRRWRTLWPVLPLRPPFETNGRPDRGFAGPAHRRRDAALQWVPAPESPTSSPLPTERPDDDGHDPPHDPPRPVRRRRPHCQRGSPDHPLRGREPHDRRGGRQLLVRRLPGPARPPGRHRSRRRRGRDLGCGRRVHPRRPRRSADHVLPPEERGGDPRRLPRRRDEPREPPGLRRRSVDPQRGSRRRRRAELHEPDRQQLPRDQRGGHERAGHRRGLHRDGRRRDRRRRQQRPGRRHPRPLRHRAHHPRLRVHRESLHLRRWGRLRERRAFVRPLLLRGQPGRQLRRRLRHRGSGAGLLRPVHLRAQPRVARRGPGDLLDPRSEDHQLLLQGQRRDRRRRRRRPLVRERRLVTRGQLHHHREPGEFPGPGRDPRPGCHAADRQLRHLGEHGLGRRRGLQQPGDAERERRSLPRHRRLRRRQREHRHGSELHGRGRRRLQPGVGLRRHRRRRLQRAPAVAPRGSRRTRAPA